MEASIFNIQRFSTEDGPGIRTTVFFKGCPLSCIWCHNPESQSALPELFYAPDKCIGCGACASVCPNKCHSFDEGKHVFDRKSCTCCGKCAEVCYAEALLRCGRKITTDELVSEVIRDKEFFASSNGGVTLSGGEPLLQWEFASEFLEKMKALGIHTCVETSGFASEKAFASVARYTDLFYFDFKIASEEEHIKYTGGSRKRIAQNLASLAKTDCAVVLRCPMIPDVNMNKAHFEAIEKTVIENPHISEIHLLPYHPLGASKSEQLGKIPSYSNRDFLSADKLALAAEELSAKTGRTVVL